MTMTMLSQSPKCFAHALLAADTTAISACDKAGEWARALALLDQMGEARVRPNAFTFSATRPVMISSGTSWPLSMYCDSSGMRLSEEGGESAGVQAAGSLFPSSEEVSGADVRHVVRFARGVDRDPRTELSCLAQKKCRVPRVQNVGMRCRV